MWNLLLQNEKYQNYKYQTLLKKKSLLTTTFSVYDSTQIDYNTVLLLFW